MDTSTVRMGEISDYMIYMDTLGITIGTTLNICIGVINFKVKGFLLF